ncbi:MAG TPA: pirin family protein [Pyrinomonadaceae bacterium]|nr:pirin family protein [Pyrinomonadaceae bacterium]
MLTIRRAKERGHFNHGWLNTYHTFSFDQYRDPRYMGFRNLRVINEDFVSPGFGFPTHGHRDMEIITYILEGALKHEDSMGNGSVIRPGDVQRMTAGTGVRHSEQNASKDQLVHLLQIWILPNEQDLTPGYEQKAFSTDERRDRFRLIASEDGREGSVTVHQDVSVFASVLDREKSVDYEISETRYGWLQVARGSLTINGDRIAQGDGVVIVGERLLSITAHEPSEVLLFDLA